LSDGEKKVANTAEDERAAARGFELCSRILRDHGFVDTATLYDEAQVLCAVKAQVLDDIERVGGDFLKAVEQSGNAKA
jgi:hypothetical protein